MSIHRNPVFQKTRVCPTVKWTKCVWKNCLILPTTCFGLVQILICKNVRKMPNKMQEAKWFSSGDNWWAKTKILGVVVCSPTLRTWTSIATLVSSIWTVTTCPILIRTMGRGRFDSRQYIRANEASFGCLFGSIEVFSSTHRAFVRFQIIVLEGVGIFYHR